ncbi:MAG: RNA polymerase sigma factor [Gaiellaceae bacterium]
MEPLPDEAALIEQARGGDVAAYGRLVERYQEIAYRIGYLITGSAADADDAAQAGFLKAFAGLGRFRPGAPLRPWLLQIVANEARNRRRHERRQARLLPRIGAAEPRHSAARSAEELVLADETHRHVAQALSRLRDEERLAIVTRYFLELSEAEAAVVLGCPAGTVKSRLSRGLAHLRSDLQGEHDD